MEAILSCDSSVGVHASVISKATPIDFSLTEAIVLAPSCLKEMCSSSVLLHCTIRVGRLMCRDGKHFPRTTQVTPSLHLFFHVILLEATLSDSCERHWWWRKRCRDGGTCV